MPAKKAAASKNASVVKVSQALRAFISICPLDNETNTNVLKLDASL
jgi:hypothetical protein